MPKSLMLSLVSTALTYVNQSIHNPDIPDTSTVIANKNDPTKFGTFIQEVTILDKKFFVMVMAVDGKQGDLDKDLVKYLFEKDENLGA